MIANSKGTFTVLTAQEVAAIMRKSKTWVYDHAYELGASRIGGSPIFTLEGLENAVSRTRRNISGNSQDQGEEGFPEARVQHIPESAHMGSGRAKKERAAAANRLGLRLVGD
jgi:hypothetical protein